MTVSPPRLPGQKRDVLRWVVITGALVILVAMIAVAIGFAVWRNGIRNEIEGQIAAIRKAGLPTNWEELSEWPVVVPDEDNAALIYTNAIAQLRSDSIPTQIEFDLPARGVPLSDELRAAATASVTTNQAALDLLRRASLLPRARYPVDYLQGPNALLPHLAGLKQSAQLLAFDAVLKAEQGDATGAAASVSHSILAARSLDNEPILLSQLVATAMLTISCQSLERVLCRASLSNPVLAELSEQMNAAESSNRLHLALVGERASTGEMIRLFRHDARRAIEMANTNSSEEEQVELPSRNPGVGWNALGFFDRDRAFFLRALETNLAILALSPPSSLQHTNELEALITQAQKRYYIMSALFLPSLSRVPVRDASFRASLRTAITALAIERWRLNHNGETPDALQTLVPDLQPSVPEDPFDGQPPRYKRLPRGYVVYSIGPNQRDDDGREKPSRRQKVPREERNNYDITFTVER